MVKFGKTKDKVKVLLAKILFEFYEDSPSQSNTIKIIVIN